MASYFKGVNDYSKNRKNAQKEDIANFKICTDEYTKTEVKDKIIKYKLA